MKPNFIKRIGRTMSALSILICSCDRYRSVWNLHLDYLDKYWADCPYPIFLGTDSLASDRVPTLNCGDQQLAWSLRVYEWLMQLDSDYVLVTLDDFILRSPVSTEDIQHCLDFAIQKQIDCIRLRVRPKPFYRDADDSLFGKYEISMPYFVSLQAAIWKRDTLTSLIQGGESIWEFEHRGTERAQKYGKLKFYGVYKTLFDYGEHIIDGSKLLRTSIYNLPLEKYELSFPIIPLKTEFIILYKRVLHFLVHRSPLPLRLALINLQSKSGLKSNTIQEKTDQEKTTLNEIKI
jgi:hypothetical protein